ncbi:type II secretion system F family protein [Candidatus Micrarchaeota archaeon]|nr:type II secretion system F family protein [Candidatus Micrarchaeota archaeon]
MIEKFFSELERELIKGRINESVEEYLKKRGFYSVILALTAFFLYSLIVSNLIEGIIVGGIVFVLGFSFFLLYPKARKNRIKALIERDLPFALMAMAVELNLNIPFEKTIENTAGRQYGIISVEFSKVVREIKHYGSSLQEALFHLSERNDSLMLKRSMAQLVSIYEHGSKTERGTPIKRLAEELLSKQKAESKEFSGKLVVFSLVFIALSAILPALFQSFVSIGSMFLELEFTALQIIIIVTVFFPLIDAGILLFIKLKTPVFLNE